MKSLQASLSTLLLAVVASTALAQQDDILRPEEAYRYAVADTGDAIEIDWVIEDGYYLYRNKMSYQSGSDAISNGLADFIAQAQGRSPVSGQSQVEGGRRSVGPEALPVVRELGHGFGNRGRGSEGTGGQEHGSRQNGSRTGSPKRRHGDHPIVIAGPGTGSRREPHEPLLREVPHALELRALTIRQLPPEVRR